MEFLRWLIKLLCSLFGKKESETVNQSEMSENENEIQEEQESETETEETNNIDTAMSKYSKIRVHVDDGHASTTPGKRSSYLCSGVLPALELYEWKSNREIGALIREGLEKEGFSVHTVTPESDVDVSLVERYKRANKDKAQYPDYSHLFLSVHSNAHGHGDAWTSARGWCIYTTKGQNNSDKLATCIYNRAAEIIPKLGSTLRKNTSDGDPDLEENFTVIYGANMPAVLTENLFYTNVEDTKILLSEEGKRAIAEIHVKGIMDYCDKYILKDAA